MGRVLCVAFGVLLAPAIGLGGDIVTDGTFTSTRTTGAGPPIEVLSEAVVAHLNADMVDGVDATDLAPVGHVHTLSLVKTYGSPTFAMAPPHGQTIECTFPAINCQIMTSGTTNLYFPLGIEGPSILTRVTCRVSDDDGGTEKEISMSVIDGASLVLGTDTTSGAPGLVDLVVDTAAVIDDDSRGPTVHVRAVRGSESMFVYHCYAEYTIEVK